jgi:hypothetical protein
MNKSVDDNIVFVANYASKTSRDAAEKVLPKSGSIRRSIYDFIKSNGQATDFELEQFLSGKHQTVSASRRSLVIDGFIMDSGRTKKNAEGNDCTIWVLAPINDRLF